MPLAIDIANVTKIYHPGTPREVRALDGLSFSVQKGEVFGLLGRNGAGKTTLLRILTTLLQPTQGTVTLLGIDVARHPYEARRRLCSVMQEYSIELYLNVQDNLDTFARFHGLTRRDASRSIETVLARFGLEEYRRAKGIDLSGGVKRRVQVAKAFMVDSPLLFLDEPTTGMDPITKRATLEAIREEAGRGRTIFLTTHILQEAEELCSTIALIDRGRLAALGDLSAIRAMVTNAIEMRMTFAAPTEELLAALRSLPVTQFEQSGATVSFATTASELRLLESLGRIINKHPVIDIAIHGATLEDAYHEILGAPGRGKTP